MMVEGTEELEGGTSEEVVVLYNLALILFNRIKHAFFTSSSVPRPYSETGLQYIVLPPILLANVASALCPGLGLRQSFPR